MTDIIDNRDELLAGLIAKIERVELDHPVALPQASAGPEND